MFGSAYSRFSLGVVCFLIIFLPLARGGVHPWAVSILQAAVLAGGASLVLEGIHLRRPLALLGPLTRPAVALLVLAGFSALVSPFGCGEGLWLLITYVLGVWVVRTAVRGPRDLRILAYTCLGTGVFLCVLGVFKRYGLNPFGFWEYDELSYGREMLASSFNNHNHLACFLAMVLPFVWVLFINQRYSRARTIPIAYGAALILGTLFLTLSRGGWISAVTAMGAMGICLWRRKRISSRTMAVTAAVLALFFSLLLLTQTEALDRAATWAEKQDAASMASRLIVWSGTIDMILDAPLTGTGPGSFGQSFTRYQPPGLSATFHQAHNDYLQAMGDLGVLVIPILIWGGIRVLAHCRKITAKGPCDMDFYPGFLAAFTAMGIHSFLDFNLHIPANAFLGVVILGMAAWTPPPLGIHCPAVDRSPL